MLYVLLKFCCNMRFLSRMNPCLHSLHQERIHRLQTNQRLITMQLVSEHELDTMTQSDCVKRYMCYDLVEAVGSREH